MSRDRATTRSRASLLVLPLVALLAVAPLLVRGCSCGHDFDFHILSWLEAATQFAHGNLHPHWAFTPAYNAGEPRFVFYPPLSWTIGGALGLLLPWTVTPIVYTWLALTAAGLACYRLLREFAEPATALLVASLYTVNPSMLFTAYERTAYAELLAAAWLPLLLHGILRRRVTIPGLAVPVALLWLTNAPAAVIGCYGLAIIGIVRLLQRSSDRRQLAINTVSGTALGIGVAAFYILPAAYERRSVEINLAMVEGMRIVDNFLFHHTPDAAHDAVLHTASLLAVSLLPLTAAALFIGRRQAHKTLAPLAAVTIAIALLLTPFSAPVWRHAPELAFLQFPWRFLALLTPVLALAIALAARSLPLTRAKATVASLFLAAALIAFGYHVFQQECDPEDTVAARVALFHSPAGSDPTDEYTPMTADNDALAQTNPPFWMAADAAAPTPPQAAGGPLHWPLDVQSPTAQTLILNLRDYPAWRVSLNHRLITTRLERADGLIAIPIAAGLSHLDLVYARSADQTAGGVVSAVSLVLLAILLYRRRPPR